MSKVSWRILICLSLAVAAVPAALPTAADAAEAPGTEPAVNILALTSDVDADGPQVTLLTQNDAGYTLRLDLPYLETEEIELAGDTYTKLAIPGGGWTGAVGQAGVPTFTRLVAVPAEAAVQVAIQAKQTERFSGYKLPPQQQFATEEVVVDRDWYAAGEPSAIAVATGAPALLHSLRVVPVTFSPVAYDPISGEIEVASSLTVTVSFAGSDLRNVPQRQSRSLIPESFDRIYSQTVIGYERDPDTVVGPGSYLMICPNSASVIAAVQPLLEWRRRQGYNVVFATTAETGTDKWDIKSFIQARYNDLEIPLEFVSLIGDATGTISIPTWREDHTYYHGEGDHEYTRLNGGDPVADIHLGRLSVDSIGTLNTVVDKIVNYESDPYMSNTDWFVHAGLTGDPTSSTGYSAIWVNQWAKHQLLGLGYTQIDTIWSGNFVSQMLASVNQGATIFTYRGWLGMSGMNSGHIGSMNNGRRLTFAVIMTCDTGSFESDGNCRSEAFLRAPNGGGVAAVGTATSGTHTRYNNCMFQGVLEGALNSGDNRAGPAITRGKQSMYENYHLSEPENVLVWSTWNSLMGDPCTSIYTAVPQQLDVVHPALVSIGTNAVPVSVSADGMPLEGALVALYKAGEVRSVGYTDAGGHVYLLLEGASEGEVQLTVTGRNLRPYLGGVNVGQVALSLDLVSVQVIDDGSGQSQGNGDGKLNPGEVVELAIQLQNNGTSGASDVSAALVCDEQFINIDVDEQDFGYIGAGATAWSENHYVVTVADDAPGGVTVALRLLASTGSDSFLSLVPEILYGPNLVAVGSGFTGPGGDMDPGESGGLFVTLNNVGNENLAGATGVLTSLSRWVSVTDANGTFPEILAGYRDDNADDPFGVTIAPDCFPGHLATFQVDLIYDTGARGVTTFQATVGTAESTDPVGPDNYGYYAFDNTDIGYAHTPVYDWIEIDPGQGGAGTSVGLTDFGRYQDDTKAIDLPFPFTYYGQNFDNVSICSNGWIGMGACYLVHYRNWTIPSPGSPDNMIAPFWDDLYLQSGTGGVFSWYDVANHRFIIEWSQLRHYSGNVLETFEVILYDPSYYPTDTGDGKIVFQYDTIQQRDSETGYATVGIQNEERTDGVLYTYWNRYADGAATLAAGRAITFVPMVPSVTGVLLGEITNNSGGGTPIEEARVTVLGTARVLQSDADGHYQGNVPIGEYCLAVFHESFSPDTTCAVVILEDEQTVVNFALDDIGGPAITGTTIVQSSDDTTGPYEVETTITDYTGVADTHFYYTSSASGGPFELPLEVVDAETGLLRAQIPGQPLGTRVQYWLTAADVVGNTSSDPAGAPFANYSFLVAETETFYVAEMENDGGWTVGDPQDSATSGIWERDDPNGVYENSTEIQPEDDHTPAPGTDCWLTGNDPPGSSQGTDDVDGGQTTLKSPVFDLAAYGGVTVDYFRWYTNNTGNSPGQDNWRVQVTNGDDWVDMENTTLSDRSWLERSFPIGDYVAITSSVQFRFIAEDQEPGSVVEAAVDDFSLTGYVGVGDIAAPTVTVTAPNGGQSFATDDEVEVTWNGADDIGVVHVVILLSTDGGASYPDTVATGPFNESFMWLVPAVNSSACRLQVECYDALGNVGSDASDANFAINGVTGVDDVPVRQLALHHNVPNPFNPRTEITFALPKAQPVTLRVYDLTGKVVRTLASGEYPAGTHSVVWQGENDRGAQVASGVYFYRLSTAERDFTHKMLLLK